MFIYRVEVAEEANLLYTVVNFLNGLERDLASRRVQILDLWNILVYAQVTDAVPTLTLFCTPSWRTLSWSKILDRATLVFDCCPRISSN